MPFVFLFFGFIVFVVGIRGRQQEAAALLQEDFTGNNNFLVWLIALFVIGSIGYVKAFEPLVRAFVILIMIAMILSNGRNGLFNQFRAQVFNRNSSGQPAASPSPSTIPAIPPIGAR